ncbi:Sugar transferase involved in LPS biosynthesis (colanic, teichoic acid) [Marivirga sericea]|uniref:Sugar transferase involved in LPS biosynthesis (Colanic, teichoic acid) n=1 Tax=Marivirga sericea TaxID=1028 RepID=A0A1X7KLB0_9BACT|nr:sugar transferase [Marivirga sericea]SMG41932.1 Sugar transferase involved in LPS biosynthesis (colanic, teichoic acid) [Marivirga sericea]
MQSINYVLEDNFDEVWINKHQTFNKKLYCVTNEVFETDLLKNFSQVEKFTVPALIRKLENIQYSDAPDVIIFYSSYIDGIFFENLSSIGHLVSKSGAIIPVIIVSDKIAPENKKKVLQHGADDCFPIVFNPEKLNYWIDFLKLFKKLSKEDEQKRDEELGFKISRIKRVFDVLVSGSLLLLASPIMLLISIIIKLESKGPVFYISKRAGVGYKVFNFMKFRSMSVGADQELSKLMHLNQYENKDDNGANPVFFKIKGDPRITKFGKFLRDSSLDELPQLINVLKGDMSIVGNRPLPLYEAQQLTKDQCALRFMAAAGITGLWQVTKRGKGEMSEEERIALDVDYAKNNSFIKDMKLLLKTFPALVQEERV